VGTFESIRKKELGWWGRVKMLVGRKEQGGLEAFDPFAVEE
jgi:hypothetical protein